MSDTTERDVALDLIAALEMYEGLIGGDDVTLDSVDQGQGEDRVVLTLSNGDAYELRVRRV